MVWELSEPGFAGLVDLQDYESEVSKCRLEDKGVCSGTIYCANTRGAMNCATTNSQFLNVKLLFRILVMWRG